MQLCATTLQHVISIQSEGGQYETLGVNKGSLLVNLNDSRTYAQAYADDVACILMVFCRKAQRTINKIDTWCSRERRLDSLIPIILKGVAVQISSDVNYLGVTLDAKLS